MVEVEMFPAKEGDCFLITLIKQDYRILVDGGTAQTYKDYLRTKLLELSQQGKKIDLLIVTHIDNDHIGGIISLFKENGSYDEANVICIEEIWHNSYRHFYGLNHNKLKFREKEILTSIISKRNVQDEYDPHEGEQEISAVQGTTLAGFLYKGNYNWNSMFEGKAVSCESKQVIDIADDCFIQILSPDEKALSKLMNVWKHELMESKFDFEFTMDSIFDDAFEYYMRYLNVVSGKVDDISSSKDDLMSIDELVKIVSKDDEKATNNSSIAFVLSCCGKRLLFLGDMCTKNIEYGVLENEFDLIKIPHHGSTNNIDFEFITKFKSLNYLISTNGKKYQHPNIDVIAKIIASNFDEKHIYFNYCHDKIIPLFNTEVRNTYNCQLHSPEENKNTIVYL